MLFIYYNIFSFYRDHLKWISDQHNIIIVYFCLKLLKYLQNWKEEIVHSYSLPIKASAIRTVCVLKTKENVVYEIRFDLKRSRFES